MSQENKRDNSGLMCGIVGSICNLFLFIFKLIFGIIINSISLIGDALNNAFDSISNFVTLISFKLNKMPADKRHPYGHKRSEYIGGLIVSILISVTAIELFINSISSLITPVIKNTLKGLFIVFIVNFVIKLILAIYYKLQSKKLNSLTLKANYKDAIFDILANSIVVFGLYLSKTINYDLDGILGIILSVIMLINSISLILESSSNLLVELPDDKLVKEVSDLIKSDSNILGTHDIMFHQYGIGNIYMIAHVEMDSRLTLIQAHNIIDQIERNIKESYNIDCSIHIDPIDLMDEELKNIKNLINKIIKEYDNNLSCHDIHIEKINKRVYFDLELPYKYSSKSKEIKNDLINRINNNIDYKTSIEINYK